MIHPSAIIHPKACLGVNVSVGAYSLIEENVELGDNCTLASHVVLRSGTRLKANVSVDSFSVLGGLPQSIGFDANKLSSVVVGEYSVLREGVTVHRATLQGGVTRVGAHAFLMGGVHIGHDCQVGNHVIMANDVLLAGHVIVEDYCNLGGNAVAQQFIRIGESAMIGGISTITQDVLPFTMVAERNRTAGLNLVGLKRRSFPREVIIDLKQCYHAVFSRAGSIRNLASKLLDIKFAKTKQGNQFLEFITQQGKKGFASPLKRVNKVLESIS